jgi:hypothetical protein
MPPRLSKTQNDALKKRPPHPATVVQEKAPHPAKAWRGKELPPHPATVGQPKPAFGGVRERPPHPATVVQPNAPRPKAPKTELSSEQSPALEVEPTEPLRARVRRPPAIQRMKIFIQSKTVILIPDEHDEDGLSKQSLNLVEGMIEELSSPQKQRVFLGLEMPKDIETSSDTMFGVKARGVDVDSKAYEFIDEKFEYYRLLAKEYGIDESTDPSSLNAKNFEKDERAVKTAKALAELMQGKNEEMAKNMMLNMSSYKVGILIVGSNHLHNKIDTFSYTPIQRLLQEYNYDTQIYTGSKIRIADFL